MRQLAPSTEWQERIAEGEEERYEGYARTFAEIQAHRSRKYGPGRALHRKQVLAAHGTLEVLDGLPGYAKHGLFQVPRDYEVWVRLSNGSFDRAPDRMPDIRGFSIRTFGVHGESALGNGPARHQDFTLINQNAFAFAASDEFVAFVRAAADGKGALLRHVISRYGLVGGPLRLARLIAATGKPFRGFASEPFFSALPMANGPYAVRLRLLPSQTNGPARKGASEDWALDFASRLKERALHWDLQVQYFANEEQTPIEDASVNWSTPYSTVARLMLPEQDLAAPEAIALAKRVEAGVFDPWQALAEHRPLGDVQRARRVVYYRSQQGRGAS